MSKYLLVELILLSCLFSVIQLKQLLPEDPNYIYEIKPKTQVSTANEDIHVFKKFVSLKEDNKEFCIYQCSLSKECVFIQFDCNKCTLYNKFALLYLIKSDFDELYQKVSKDSFDIDDIIHYWPFSANVDDIIGGKNLVNGSNVALVNDRYNRPSSALRLTNGYYVFPPSVYIYEQSTFTMWFRFNSINFPCIRLVEFSTGYLSDHYTLCTGDKTSLNGFQFGYQDDKTTNGRQAGVYLNRTLILNRWYHLAVTLDRSVANLYLDGVLTNSRSDMNVPKAVVRNVSYLGGNSVFDNKYANATFDEIKIWKRILSLPEIVLDMTKYALN